MTDTRDPIQELLVTARRNQILAAATTVFAEVFRAVLPEMLVNLETHNRSAGRFISPDLCDDKSQLEV